MKSRSALDLEYPVSDGEPMAESDEHRDEMQFYAIDVLRRHFSDRPAYVSGNNFVYYREGDPRAVVSPDCYVVPGVEAGLRDTFKVWLEGGHTPCFVLEISSKSTRLHDLGDKMARYRDDLRVPEYFLFDLWGEWIAEKLRGFRLEQGVYQPVHPANGRLSSAALGLELAVQANHLRFFEPGSAEPLATQLELASLAEGRAEREYARAEQERTRAERAEQELQRLRALLDAQQGS